MERLIDVYQGDLYAAKRNQGKRASAGNRYLTQDEEGLLINSLVFLASLGHPVDEEEIMRIMNEIIFEGRDERLEDGMTREVVRKLMRRYPDLKFLKANSLDPLRAAAASEEVRDGIFTRLDYFVHLLYKMGVWEFERACDVPAERWFNFDEVCTDPTKHKRKVLFDASVLSRLFQITPEGDRMNSHVTTGIFTQATGE